MRDIVNSNGFSASDQQTKTKITKMPSNPSGTLTKADYRSYRDFLGSYGDKNSKDDQESVSSNESGICSSNLSESKSNNTSTSSLNSEINGTSFKNVPKTETNTGVVASRTGSFRNYLDSYKQKTFSSVKPVASKQNIKSEIIIQVNDPLEQQDFVTTINGDVAALRDDTINSCPPLPNSLPPKMLNGHQRSKGFSYLPPPPPPPVQEKFNQDEADSFPPPPPPIAFANNGDCTFLPPPPPPPLPELADLNKSGKKWNNVEVDEHAAPKQKINQSEKLSSNHAAATNLAKILTQHLLPRKLELEKQLQEEVISNKPSNERKILETPPLPPKLPENRQNSPSAENYTCFISCNVGNTPAVPPPPSLPRFSINPPPRIDYCTLPRKPIGSAPKLPQSPPPKFEPHTIPKQPQKMDLVPPKLPRSPPPKFENHTITKMDLASPKLPRSHPPLKSTNSSGSVDFNTTTVVPVNDAATKVSKNDPNVRKLVYNTYRGLLGAYNNKANDMIATLPRSRVREDQGVSKQLESIALQGGLEKLNGRTNPNVEQDEVHNQ